MENYDILMLIVLVAAALFGAIKGFAWQLASLASIFVSYVVAYQFREPFSQSIHAEPPWNRFLAMLILYVGTSLVIWVAFRMISGTIDRLKLREFDRHVGAVFGLAKGALFCTLITLFAVTLLGDNLREKIVASKSGRYIAQVLVKSESVIPPEIHDVVRPYLERFDQRFHGTEGGSDSGGVFPWIADRVTSGDSGQDSLGDRLPEAFWDVASQAADQLPSQRTGPQYGQPGYGQPPINNAYHPPSGYNANANAPVSDQARPTYGRSFGQPSSYRSQ